MSRRPLPCYYNKLDGDIARRFGQTNLFLNRHGCWWWGVLIHCSLREKFKRGVGKFSDRNITASCLFGVSVWVRQKFNFSKTQTHHHCRRDRLFRMSRQYQWPITCLIAIYISFITFLAQLQYNSSVQYQHSAPHLRHSLTKYLIHDQDRSESDIST